MHNTNWADQMEIEIEIIGLVMVHKGDLQINTEEICNFFFYSFSGLQFAIYNMFHLFTGTHCTFWPFLSLAVH